MEEGIGFSNLAEKNVDDVNFFLNGQSLWK